LMLTRLTATTPVWMLLIVFAVFGIGSPARRSGACRRIGPVPPRRSPRRAGKWA
jgi:hypothetical protein